jgi:hypothetical protein
MDPCNLSAPQLFVAVVLLLGVIPAKFLSYVSHIFLAYLRTLATRPNVASIEKYEPTLWCASGRIK